VQLTEDAKKVLQFAQREARRANHSWVGTEHLLLGLIQMLEEEASVGGLLALRRSLPSTISVHDIRESVIRKIPFELGDANDGDPEATSRMKLVLRHAQRLATNDSRESVDTGDLVLGMFWSAGGIGDQTLIELGITPEVVVNQLVEVGALRSPVDVEDVLNAPPYADYGEVVNVGSRDLEVLLENLPKRLAANAPLAFNTGPEEGQAWIAAGKGIDLRGHVDQILAEKGS